MQQRAYDKLEIVADVTIHLAGILVALGVGSTLVVYAATGPGNEHIPAVLLYVVSLLGVLGVSLAFNVWPVTTFKDILARLDQAVIFLFIAASYTPFLVMLDRVPASQLLAIVWVLALIGVALKLLVPQRFGRIAILLYLAIGWSGLLVLESLRTSISPAALLLLIGGGLTYSFGIIFHLWQRLRFHNALWHLAVVLGASLHLGAAFDTIVLNQIQ